MKHPMFISVLDLFKIGIGPSSSHTLGPLVAAGDFLGMITTYLAENQIKGEVSVRCILKGSLAYTGKGHASDRAITLGLNGYLAKDLGDVDLDELVDGLWQKDTITTESGLIICFSPDRDVVFDRGEPLPEHPNGMIFELTGSQGEPLLSETYFSIGGGFINKHEIIHELKAPLKMESALDFPYPFKSAKSMLTRSRKSGKSIAAMKRKNELEYLSKKELNKGLDEIWQVMEACIESGLTSEKTLPGGLNLARRAKALHTQLVNQPDQADVTDWLCAYAMAVSEENAAGHRVVTAPTNGAAGVIPAVLYYLVKHEGGTKKQIRKFLLTAAAVGGIIKLRSSISGAEVGCQGEIGSASSMAAAGLCAVRGGSSQQIENAAEIAIEHHLGLTCDPIKGLVQVPCIERNGFGAIKAYTAASLAIRGTGRHFVSLDSCIAAMKQTGLEMSVKFKETSLGGLAVSNTEC